MKILLSNDDGISALGLQVLIQALSDIAEIIVVAPDRNRSGASNSLTLDNPIRLRQVTPGYYSIEGTPTDCVHLAVTGLLDEKPDMVVAGINEGANLGDDVFYSGTVAAAIEGQLLGIPSMAISLVSNDLTFTHYETAGHIAKQLVQQLQANPLPMQTLLNVNVPSLLLNELRGIEVTRLGRRHNAEPIIKGKDPRGKEIYWVGQAGPESDAGVGTDFYAVASKKVSITPLLLDLTHYQALEHVAGWIDGLKF